MQRSETGWWRTGSLFPLKNTRTPLEDPAMSYALLVIRATVSLSRMLILNLARSGLKVMQVNSSPSKGLMLASPALPMLLYQVCGKNKLFDPIFLTSFNTITLEQIWTRPPLTCLKVFLDSLQAVSTVNFVLKMLQSFAPYPLRPPEEQVWVKSCG